MEPFEATTFDDARATCRTARAVSNKLRVPEPVNELETPGGRHFVSVDLGDGWR